ncbi:MAG: hypothetical protein M3R68_01760, partial [Acidobacteriota bacterium]|nr:hypothetical protein [Acidobacteriota bacterium]
MITPDRYPYQIVLVVEDIIGSISILRLAPRRPRVRVSQTSRWTARSALYLCVVYLVLSAAPARGQATFPVGADGLPAWVSEVG